MVASRVATFLDDLRASQLLDVRQVDEVARAVKQSGDDPTPLAREFVQRKLLTPFQVNHLVRGTARELVLGPYRLLDRVGEGGMGQVFKASHQMLNRVVALKVMRKDKLSNPSAVRRFNQEIRAAAQLVHPNIVMAFDAGQADDTHYFAMEYVEGTDLLKLVKGSGPLPVALACDCIRQVALGLQHAHGCSLIHRDIKPSNLLLTQSQGSQSVAAGQVKILDMGLARLQSDDGAANGLTKLGTVVGTMEYVAPEQARNSSTVDGRADLYSLGCTFYFLLTGQTPFKGSTPTETVMARFSQEPAPLDSFRKDVPTTVQAILKKLMALKPEDRFQSAAEVANALAAHCAQPASSVPAGNSAARPVVAPKAGPSTPLPRQIQPDRAIPVVSRRPGRRSSSKGPVVAAGFGLFLLAGAVAAVVVYPKLANLGPGNSREPSPVAKAKASPSSESVARAKTTPEPTVRTDVKPEPKVEPVTKVEPKAKPEPKPVPRKPPVPDAAELAAAEKTIRETYKVEFGRKKAEDMVALAVKLLTSAGSRDDPAARFVLLREARDLAAVAGHPETMLKAIEEMDNLYAIDVLEMKIAALEKASKAPNVPPAMRSIAEAALKLVEELVDADNYDAALRVMLVALTAARKANNAVFLAKVTSENKEVVEISKEYQAAKPARQTLDKAPDDGDASFQWGRFLAYLKAHWGEGLPLLGRGSDDKAMTQAQKDQANTKDPAEQVAVGDGWFDLGAADKLYTVKKNLWLRAKFWYEQALPGLSAENKSKVEKRLKDIEAFLPKEDTASTPTVMTPSTPKPVTPKSDYDSAMQYAASLYKAGRYAEAAESYKKALTLMPDDARAQKGLKQSLYALAIAQGTAYATQGKLQDAAKEFQKALDEMPGDPLAEQYLNYVTKASTTGGRPGASPFMRRGRGLP